MLVCSVCGSQSFIDKAVLWDELSTQWQLSPEERRYIDRQQGTACIACGANLRSIALADAIRSAFGTPLLLNEFVATVEAKNLSVLEINEAGLLSPTFRTLPKHTLAMYPAIDIHALPYSSNQFDLVIHSDTLEHVAQPVAALAECRRVTRPGGWLCFTIPTVVGRLTRSRDGLKKSFHGDANVSSDDWIVHTEFGADMWCAVLRAGYSACTIHSVEFPAALAISAQK